jgi:hypothetical protein
MLVDHPNAQANRFQRTPDFHWMTIDPDLTIVRLIKPGEDIHQGRLARPVLAEQCMNFAMLEIETTGFISDNARKALPDIAHLQQGRGIAIRRRITHDHATLLLKQVIILGPLMNKTIDGDLLEGLQSE